MGSVSKVVASWFCKDHFSLYVDTMQSFVNEFEEEQKKFERAKRREKGTMYILLLLYVWTSPSMLTNPSLCRYGSAPLGGLQ